MEEKRPAKKLVNRAVNRKEHAEATRNPCMTKLSPERFSEDRNHEPPNIAPSNAAKKLETMAKNPFTLKRLIAMSPVRQAMPNHAI